MTELWLIFISGLTVSGISCLAVQGGLLASVIANQKHSSTTLSSRFLPTFSFLVAKLIVYTLMGGLLGLVGSWISINYQLQIFMQAVAGIYMIILALNLLQIHPIFRYAVIQPPKFLAKLVRNQSKQQQLYAPILLGIMTILIPCGSTIAMQVLAVTSGNIWMGAAIMASFTLGTSPLFLGLGLLTETINDRFKYHFSRIAGAIIIFLGISSINGALVVSGSPITIQSIIENSPVQFNFSGEEIDSRYLSGVTIINGVQQVDLQIAATGYNPSFIRVQSGKPVQLNLTTTNAYSCTSSFRIPSLGIVKTLLPNDTGTVSFTPTQPGKITFSCSMGLYRGVIEVI